MKIHADQGPVIHFRDDTTLGAWTRFIEAQTFLASRCSDLKRGHRNFYTDQRQEDCTSITIFPACFLVVISGVR